MVSRAALVAQTLVLDRLTASVADTLDAAGVPLLLLKGPAVASAFYAEGEVRVYQDIDVLVPAEQFDAAVSALAAAGWERPQEHFRPSERTRGGEDLVFRRGGMLAGLDLHRTFHRVRRPEQAWEVFSRRPRALPVGNRTVPAPALHIQGLVAGLHATAVNNEPGSRSHTDLAKAVRRLTIGQWRDALAAARELDAEGALADGLRMVEGGDDLLEQLGVGAVTDPEVPLRGEALSWYRVRHQSSRAEVVRLFLFKLFPSRARVRVDMLALGETRPLWLFYVRRWGRLIAAVPGLVAGGLRRRAGKGGPRPPARDAEDRG